MNDDAFIPQYQQQGNLPQNNPILQILEKLKQFCSTQVPNIIFIGIRGHGKSSLIRLLRVLGLKDQNISTPQVGELECIKGQHTLNMESYSFLNDCQGVLIDLKGLLPKDVEDHSFEPEMDLILDGKHQDKKSVDWKKSSFSKTMNQFFFFLGNVYQKIPMIGDNINGNCYTPNVVVIVHRFHFATSFKFLDINNRALGPTNNKFFMRLWKKTIDYLRTKKVKVVFVYTFYRPGDTTYADDGITLLDKDAVFTMTKNALGIGEIFFVNSPEWNKPNVPNIVDDYNNMKESWNFLEKIVRMGTNK